MNDHSTPLRFLFIIALFTSTLLHFPQAIAKETSLYANGDLSEKISLNELFINPTGQDTKKEWLELKNNSPFDINLGNWKIISKNHQFIISDKINIPKEKILVIENLNFSLKNTNNEILLLDFNNKIIDRVRYDQPQENLSLSKITVVENNFSATKWLETASTKNEPNQIFYKLEGLINKVPEISDEFYFGIKNQENHIFKIIFDEKIYDFSTLHTLLPQNRKTSLIGEKINKETYFLQELTIENTSPEIPTKQQNPTKKEWQYLLIIPLAITVAIVICLLFRH